MTLNYSLLSLALLFSLAEFSVAQPVDTSVAQSERADSLENAGAPDPSKLKYTALLSPKRNISAGEQLTEEDFDQLIVGMRLDENMDRLLPASFDVEGKYASVDLFKGSTIEKGAIAEQLWPTPPSEPPAGNRGFADELAWFSFEKLSPGTVVPGFRLQLKRIRKDDIPSGAIPPDFTPPKHFRVIKQIDTERPIERNQIEAVD